MVVFTMHALVPSGEPSFYPLRIESDEYRIISNAWFRALPSELR
jgi:hypothetical protein